MVSPTVSVSGIVSCYGARLDLSHLLTQTTSTGTPSSASLRSKFMVPAIYYVPFSPLE